MLHIQGGTSVPAAVRRLRSRAAVASAVPNYLAHASGYIPDDPGRLHRPRGWVALQWNFLPATGINMPAAWVHASRAGGSGGKGVTVAVLDTGVAYRNHGRHRRSPDFRPYQFVRGYDFVGHDRHPDDPNGHGTFVAGEIAERVNNGIGVTGIAYRSRIMPVRVLGRNGYGDAERIARGVRFAVRHHAQVINLSLVFDSGVRRRDIPELLRALRYAHRHGVLVVGAGGNDGARRAAYPARAGDVLSVGATTIDRCVADYSDDGVDLVAPGGGRDAYRPGDPNCHPTAHHAFPDIYQMTYIPRSHKRFGLPGGYAGTSMAAPAVSGVAALVISSRILGRHPKPGTLTAWLEHTATDLGPPGHDRAYGAGLLNAARATTKPSAAEARRLRLG
jgi:serine protease